MPVTSDLQTTGPTCWPCGCIAGRRLCGDAVRLWKETSSAFERGITGHDYAEYHVACRAFDAHYTMQEKGLEAPLVDGDVRPHSGPPPGSDLQITL